ncbi:MAG: arginase family protein [archaeon]
MLHTIRTFPFEYPVKQAEIALLGIPWDSSETGKSVKHGPLFIREAIRNLPGYDLQSKQNVFEKFKFTDSGDVEVTQANWKLTEEKIRDTVKELFKENPKIFPVFLGGDHLISLAALNALSEIKKEKITVIHFDAHRDLLPEWMGELYSHITWANKLLKSNKFDLIQLGIRSSSSEEEKIAKKKKIKSSLKKISGPVYVSVDLDVFDPSFAPEVGTPEPMGMNPEEFFSLLKTACKNNLIGFDLTECASEKVNSQTAILAANIFKKVLLWK